MLTRLRQWLLTAIADALVPFEVTMHNRHLDLLKRLHATELRLEARLAALEKLLGERTVAETGPISWVPDPAAERVMEAHLKQISRDAAQRPWQTMLGGPRRSDGSRS